jgi:hypothetical protein
MVILFPLQVLCFSTAYRVSWTRETVDLAYCWQSFWRVTTGIVFDRAAPIDSWSVVVRSVVVI